MNLVHPPIVWFAWFAAVRESFAALGRAWCFAAVGLAVAGANAAVPGAAPPLATAPVVSSNAAGSAGCL